MSALLRAARLELLRAPQGGRSVATSDVHYPCTLLACGCIVAVTVCGGTGGVSGWLRFTPAETCDVRQRVASLPAEDRLAHLVDHWREGWEARER